MKAFKELKNKCYEEKVLSTQAVLALGYTRSDINRFLEEGKIVRIKRGSYELSLEQKEKKRKSELSKYRNLGYKAIEEEKYQRAIFNFKKYLEISEETRYYLKVAQCDMQLHDFYGAYENLVKAFEVRENTFYDNLIFIYMILLDEIIKVPEEKFNEIVELLDIDNIQQGVISLNSKAFSCYLEASQYIQIGSYDYALKAVDKYIELYDSGVCIAGESIKILLKMIFKVKNNQEKFNKTSEKQKQSKTVRSSKEVKKEKSVSVHSFQDLDLLDIEVTESPEVHEEIVSVVKTAEPEIAVTEQPEELSIIELYIMFEESLKNRDFAAALRYLYKYETKLKADHKYRNLDYLYERIQCKKKDFEADPIVLEKKEELFNVALRKFHEGSFDETVLALDLAEDMSGIKSPAFTLLKILALKKLGSDTKEIGYYLGILQKSDCHEPLMYELLTHYYFDVKAYSKALEMAHLHNERLPLTNGKVYEIMGRCYSVLKKPAKAKKALEHAQQIYAKIGGGQDLSIYIAQENSNAILKKKQRLDKMRGTDTE